MKYVYIVLCILYAVIVAEAEGSTLTKINAECVDGKHIVFCRLIETTDGEAYIVINGKRRDDLKILDAIHLNNKLKLLVSQRSQKQN